MLQKILTWIFYILFFVTPLFFLRYNQELFEYNKMMLVYTLTVSAAGVWGLKIVCERKLILASTPLDIPIILFFVSQVLSTVFSIDPHTSIWGYYTRSNGGLLSIGAYILLYFAMVSNFKADDAVRFLKAAVFGGLAVSLYAIPEHFGLSPSCVLLLGQFNAQCWVQDVQSRVFATLGQPNWLAAYLGMLIFPTIYFFIQANSIKFKIFYGVILLADYSAFTFTYSRGGTIGFLAGLGVLLTIPVMTLSNKNPRELVFGLSKFILGYGVIHTLSELLLTKRIPGNLIEWLIFGGKIVGIGYLLFVLDIIRRNFGQFKASLQNLYKPLIGVLAIFLFINILFGSALTRFQLVREAAPPPRPAIAGGTQLENGGTESGKIRLIVWKGALEIFKHYPIFGSGVETFAYSYYLYRPVEHNLVSEWDFLYNKAHNEYLNYLATTGFLGLLSYLTIITAFIVWAIKYILGSGIWSRKPGVIDPVLLSLSILASYISYLVQNIFGFSVVVIAVFFFIFPGLAFLITGSLSQSRKPSGSYLFSIPSSIYGFVGNLLIKLSAVIYRRPVYTTAAQYFIVIISVLLVYRIYINWNADARYKKGTDFEEAGDIAQSYENYVKAVELNGAEPLYLSDLGLIEATAAVGYFESDATLSAELKNQSIIQTQTALKKSPANVSLWRTAVRTYYQLAGIDAKYEELTLKTIDETIRLAPTDPKLYYNKGLILYQLNRYPEAEVPILKALELKPNYREAYLTLGAVYLASGKKEDAAAQYEKVLELIPNDPEALKGVEAVKETK